MCDASIRFTAHRAHKSSNDEHLRTFSKPILLHRYITRYVWMCCMVRTNRRWKKKRKKKRKENTCTRANEFWHSFYTATRYDMSRDHREKNACPLENACLLTTTFYPSCNNWVDLYYTNLNSENEIDSKSIIQIFSTDYSDEITRIERTFLFFYPTRNKIIRYYYISYVYIYINFYQIF